MADRSFKSRLVPREELVTRFLDALTDALQGQGVREFYVNTNFSDRHFTRSGWNPGERRADVNEFIQTLIDHPQITVTRVHAEWADMWTAAVVPEAAVLGVTINIGRPGTDKINEHIQISEAFAQRFPPVDQTKLLEDLLPPLEKDALRHREAVLAELQNVTVALQRTVTSQAAEQQRFLNETLAGLRAQAQHESESLRAEWQTRFDELERERDEHRKEVADFETRAYTFVRRDIDRKLADLLKEFDAITVKPEISQKRYVIHVVSLVALAASGVLCGYIARHIAKTPTVDWFHLAPFTAGAVVFGSTLIYYLRWNNAWFSHLATAEFSHRKSKVDIARASWVAELLFEWKERKEVGLPRVVLERLTTSLFQPPGWKQGTLHPADQLAEVIANASKVKLGGIELEKGRKRRRGADE